MTLPIALRLALRELRGGLAGFRIFLACLALGVAAIAAVGSVRMAIEEGLSREAASILGGDAQIEFTYRFADQAERDWMAEKATEISGLVDFRSMAAFADGSGETQRALVQVKAVDGAYPLYGRVELAGGGSLAAALATRDGLPGLVAQAGAPLSAISLLFAMRALGGLAGAAQACIRSGRQPHRPRASARAVSAAAVNAGSRVAAGCDGSA